MAKKQRSSCLDDLLVVTAAGKCGDLIKKILLQLPVKTLGRFKMVSKSWCVLIESPFFFMDDDLHTNHHFGCFILLASIQASEKYSLFQISPPSSGGGGSDDDDQEEKDDKKLLVVIKNIGSWESNGFLSFSTRIIGSCDGLVCVYDIVPSEIYLWNPATNQKKTLPKPLHVVEDYQRFASVLVAFGFDVETQDFKVMLLTGNFRSRIKLRPENPPINCICRLQVYNLSSDSWRVLEDEISLPGNPFFHNPLKEELVCSTEVVCLNNGNTCFFLAHYFRNQHELCLAKNNRFVISFDFTKEIFTPIELPEHDRHQNLYLSCLGDDKLALFTVSCKPSPRGDNYCHDFYKLPPPPPPPPESANNYPEIYKPPPGSYYSEVPVCQDFNIWVLDEHDIRRSSSSCGYVKKESWRQFRSFQIEHQTSDQWSSPTCISNDGDFALLETADPESAKKMKLYNLVTKEVIKDFLSCNEVMSKAYAYKPRLVSIIGGKGGATTDSATNQA